jgi:salicylate hydroxylase
LKRQILIAGGGIGGLAAALACSRAGWAAHVMEQAPVFSEVGAGIQLGPNATRILHGWGLQVALQHCAAFPSRLQARSADTGRELGVLPLGERTRLRYGAPHACVHRADILHLLLEAVRSQALVQLHVDARLESFVVQPHAVEVLPQRGEPLQGEALVGADGVWSRVRQQMLQDAPAQFAGHLAYRAMVEQQALPLALRSQQVTVWMGAHLHVVAYPVRQGQWLNVVAIIEGPAPAALQDWDHSANAQDLRIALAHTCQPLQDLVAAINHWRLWPLCARKPMQGAHEQAEGRVALLGDAAHPMRPYMAQGAGMAIEDAACLERVLSGPDVPMEQRLHAYAVQRWQRNAQVQARSIRNGKIFHAQGPVRWGRDLAMRVLGERLMDVPWLYNGPSFKG